jgi:predicted ferric reductase
MPDSASPFPSKQQPSLWPWLRERLFPRGTNLIQWTSYVILITLIILFVLDPSDEISRWQYYSTLMALAFLLVINIVWDDLEALFSKPVTGSWVLILLSIALTFYVIPGQCHAASASGCFPQCHAGYRLSGDDVDDGGIGE